MSFVAGFLMGPLLLFGVLAILALWPRNPIRPVSEARHPPIKDKEIES